MYIKSEWVMIALMGLVLALASGLSCYFGYQYANRKCELQIAEYRNTAESEYAALLRERLTAAQTYSERVRALEQKHASELQKQRTEYDTAIADLQRDFKPNGVLAGADSARGGGNTGSAPDNSRDIVCYTRAELRDKIAQSLVIAAECDKLAADYAALLNLIEVYNDAKKRPVDKERGGAGHY